MKILALEREIPSKTAELFHPHLRAEARHIWDLQLRGIVRDIWFDAAAHTAVIMLECASAEEAGDILRTFPLVRADLITFEVIPLAPYDGFARLFEDRA